MISTQPQQSRGALGRAAERARKPNRLHMDRLKERMPFWFVALFLFVFASYQIVMNPFGFSELTQRYTQDLANVLITGPYLYPTTGHEKISVALIEDDTVAKLQEPWPWKYGTHARALDALLAYHPKAVVVDILFVDARADGTLQDLVDEVHRYNKAGVPLYFTAATDMGLGQYPIRKELWQSGVRPIDPSIIINQGIARQYPVTGRCFDPKKPIIQKQDGDCGSLALRVFKDNFPNVKVPPLEGKMELIWGTRTDPINNKWMTVPDENGNPAKCENKIGFFKRLGLAFMDMAAVRSRCPYTSIIPAESLFTGQEDKDVTHMAQGRVVFYGAGLQGVEDRSYTPVNGLIANVFIHAMALDNLITLNGKPEQDVVTIGGYTLASNPAQVLAIVPVILILSFIHIRNRNRRQKYPATGESEASMAVQFFLEKIAGFGWHMLALLLALGAGLALTMALGLSVANWIEVVFVSLVLAAMLLVNFPDAVWGYIHHVAGGRPDDIPEEKIG